MIALLGRGTGRHVHALANNRDPRRVRPRRRRRSIGSQHALGRSRKTAEQLDAELIAIVDRVTRRLRAAHRVGRTVVLRLRFDDFSRATRSHTLTYATAETHAFLTAARGLLAANLQVIAIRGLTLIGVAITNLEDELPLQLPLPLDPDDSSLLDAALDEIRQRFGTDAITRAVLLGRRAGFTMPLLPD